MSNTTQADEYAQQVAAGIRANDETGHPFGLVSDDNPADDKETGEELDAFDYLSTVLEVLYTVRKSVNGHPEYVGARLLVTFGGPNAWIDTESKELTVYWGSDVARRSLPVAFCEALDSALEDAFGDFS